jgi:hypothetical protein
MVRRDPFYRHEKRRGKQTQWTDIHFDIGMIHIPGSKTEHSNAWLPLAPVALRTPKRLHQKEEGQGNRWVFPCPARCDEREKIYSRPAHI